MKFKHTSFHSIAPVDSQDSSIQCIQGSSAAVTAVTPPRDSTRQWPLPRPTSSYTRRLTTRMLASLTGKSSALVWRPSTKEGCNVHSG